MTAIDRLLPIWLPTALLAVLWPPVGCDGDTRPSYEHSDSDSDSDSDSNSDSDSDSDSDTDTDSDTETESATEEDTDTDTWDCGALPTSPLAVEELTGPVAFHDLAFDGEGFIVGAGSGGNTLFKALESSSAVVWVSGASSIQGMDYLPGGDLVAVSQTSGLVRITPSGTMTTITPSVSGYGVQVTVGPDGMVYVGDNYALYRVDPETAAVETLVAGISARGCDFSPDYSRMYISTNDGSGDVYVADLDDDLNILGSPLIFANIPGGGPWLDGLRVDACGNVYVPSYSMSNLSRITPTGEVSVFHSWSSGQYGHGLKWGSGIGGWDDTSIYLAQPYDLCGVERMEVGVHYRI